MIQAFWSSLRACITLPLSLLLSLPAEGWAALPKRLVLFALLIPVYILLNLLHLCGMLIDELLFSAYRRVTIKHPVFIAGIPRSGTTHLHRVIACDEQFTTLRTWEVLFAPTVSERYLITFLGRLISPLSAVAGKLRTLIFGAMDDVHFFGLLEPEEDFFLFLWIDRCLLTAFACPALKKYWALGHLDKSLSTARQDALIHWYDMCVKKHLYYHGEDKILLSKNPSFTSFIPALQKHWPQAHFLFCTREPAKVVASQLSSLRPAMKLLGRGKLGEQAQQQTLDLLVSYYAMQNQLQGQVNLVPMKQLQQETLALVTGFYARAGLSVSEQTLSQLEALQKQSREYKTGHRYSLTDFGLDEHTVAAMFAHAIHKEGSDHEQEPA